MRHILESLITKTNKFFVILNNNKLFIFLFVAFPLLIIANSSSGFFCTTPIKDRFIPINNEEVFFLSLIIFLVCNFLILKLLSKKNLSWYSKLLNLFILFAQTIIIIAVILIFLQITFLNYYNRFVIEIIIYLSSITSIIILTIFAIIFFRWYSHKRNLLVLLYGAVMVSLSIHTTISLLFIYQNIMILGNEIIYDIEQNKSCSMMFASNKSTNPYNLNISLGHKNYLSVPYNIILIFSFVLTWITSVLVLRNYSKRIGRIKYYLLVSLPVVWFMLRYFSYAEILIINANMTNLLPLYMEVVNFINLTPLNILVEFNLLFGSIFFSLIFFIIYTIIPKFTQVKNAVLISALGMILLFSSREIIGLFLPSYPPLGIMTISLMGISSYLVFYGIITTIRSIARSNEIKKEISKKIGMDSQLLKNIATAENEINIGKLVKSLVEDANKKKEAGHHDLNSYEINDIVDDIVHYIKDTEKKDRGT